MRDIDDPSPFTCQNETCADDAAAVEEALTGLGESPVVIGEVLREAPSGARP